MNQSKKPSGARTLKTPLRKGKGRKVSSRRWLERQLNDPYVAEARRLGLRSRAAFKLIELDDKFAFLKPGGRVIDLGAAPGGWSQVSAERVRSAEGEGRVVAIDLLDMEPVPGVDFLKLDFMDDEAPEKLIRLLGSRADAVLSDMAANSTGHRQTDHLRIMALCEAALEFAREILAPGGVFMCKVLRGGTEHELLAEMRRDFASVSHFKPEASRSDSAETYVVARGFRGEAA